MTSPFIIPRREFALALIFTVFVSLAAAAYTYLHRYTLYYGDAEAHLNIARRWIDSRTPGPEQLGTAWLPLPHLLMTPFVVPSGFGDTLWRTGLAGVIPSMGCFVLACLFLFAAARRVFSPAAAWAALAVFALNPNMLYLQSIPMTEAIFAAAFAALLWTTLWYRQSHSLWAILAAAAASNAASLTRYEGWFLIPFVAVFFLFPLPNGRGSENTNEHASSEPRPSGSRPRHALLFGGLAALGPLAWLAHNQYYYSDALAFYHGPYSALAIYQHQLAQGLARYPGDHDWFKAVQYYYAAVQSVAGWPVIILGFCGVGGALFQKNLRGPLLLLSLSPLFYVVSMHSSGTPIYVPDLWPNSWYNTRYGLAALPVLAIGAGSLVNHLSGRWAWGMVALTALFATAANPICWKESQVNSEARRAWTQQAASFLRSQYHPGDGIIYYFGDLTGVFREAGINLHEGLHQDNGRAWDAAVIRPELFLREEWALALEGDPVDLALKRAQTLGLHYELLKRVTVPGAPAVEIYRRPFAR